MDVYLQNSILAFEFTSLKEALEIVELYVVKAQTISVYSFNYNPYVVEHHTVHPQQLVTDKESSSVATCLHSLVGRLYKREEDYQQVVYPCRTIRNRSNTSYRIPRGNHYRRSR